ncbi:MAG: DUF4838 domain-containing protein [Verrucomicrobia bacterium]|nr:DUF4838 domain-containing protein [Verrucomicrobiota bacterium]
MKSIVFAVLAVAVAWSVPAEIVLTQNGAARVRIVTAAEAIPSERYAAEELQHYIEKMSGAKLPIVTDAEPTQTGEIWLGDNARLRQAGSKIDFAALGAEGFVLRTEDERLIIAGGRPRGTLYGVYALLEEKLGVRWFTPELEIVPKRDQVTLPKLDETVVPALEYREVFWTEMMRNADFAARHRLNGQAYALKDKHGGRAVKYHPFVHSFDALIPPSLYTNHPDYFPLINGKRKNGYVQRCLTNPDVLKLAKERVREWIKQHPEATILSVSQNDCINNCQCEKCKAIDDAEGTPMGSLLQFVNAIAADLEKDFPNVRLDTLAYQYTRMPPKTLRPHKNVIIRLCSIECCFAHPLETCPAKENARFRDDILAWQPVAPLLYVWDYTPNFAHYLMPFPNFDALQPNIQFFVKHGVKGLFEQGNYSGGGNGEMGPLRAYLLAKLIWDPNADVKKHTDEFVNAYFGKAAPKILLYLYMAHGPVRLQNLHAHIFDSPKSAYYTEDVLALGEKLLDDAEQLAENDAVKLRVQVARLPVWYLKLAQNKVTGEARKDLLKRFVAIAKQAGISNISEGKAMAQWAKEQGVE